MEEKNETKNFKIEVIYQGECMSLSGRSQLAYAVGRDDEKGVLHLSIVGNSGRGMWCKDWVSEEAVDAILGAGDGLTAKSFHALHPGKSINTGGFVLAALRDLGLLRVSGGNTRMHERVENAKFQEAVSARLCERVPTALPDSTEPKRRRKTVEVA